MIYILYFLWENDQKLEKVLLNSIFFIFYFAYMLDKIIFAVYTLLRNSSFGEVRLGV